MNRVAKRVSIIIFGVTVLGAVRPVAAQPTAAASQPIDLSVGYQFTHTPDTNLPLGFGVDIAAPLTDSLSVVGEFAWGRNANSNVFVGLGSSVTVTQTLTTFGGGVRWSVPSSEFAPYIQLLAGAARGAVGDVTFAGTTVPGTSDTKFMVQPGVGMSTGFANGLRGFGEVDFRRVFADPGENEIRILVGLMVRFGR
jgi:hypothetical protein